ncbi:tape measure protein [Duganella sp. FT109W]|uniref:Tape measure protein n=1 Tax=Duganella margarita TaxID=2692170 RepID=A0ABW9WQX3_9BURK|nr:tape measure protein [Duganella margarita]MYN42745.1 tape measure protein [Duganella margarita]
MTVDIATLAIRIDSTQAQVAAQAMDRMRDSGARAEQQAASLDAVTRKLSQALQLLGVGAGVGAIIRMADEYTKFNAQIKLATQSQREYAAAVDDVRRIANTAQQDLAATATLYARIANGTRELGVQQKQVAAITETVNLALKVSGATAAESASAQLQLSQAFASGTLRGEEFNAVNEAAPRLMKALADGMGVPIGALRMMASEGQITSKIMADVLPGALEQLRTEAKQVQTIGGAFTVLKNNVMEFIGVQAQASGTVAILTGAIGLLADNLNLLAGVMATVAAVSIVNWLTAWTVKTYERIAAAYAQVAAENAARAATIAAAEADLAGATASGARAAATQAAILIAREEAVARLAQARTNIAAANAAIAASTAAGAQSFALRTLTLATAELATAETARAAMVAELALLGQQQARVAAQVTAATASQTAAQAALNTANAAGAASIGLASRAMGLLGGPIGIVITLLGLAATAWSVWGKKAEDGNKQAAESFDEAQARIVKGLDEQIAKNEKLIQLQKLGSTKTKAEQDLPILDQLQKASALLNDINNRTGDFAQGKGKSNDDVYFARLNVLKDIAELTTKMQKRDSSNDEAAAFGPAAQALVAVRERLTGVNKQYIDDLKALQAARDANAIGEQEYINLTSTLATETWKSSDAGKAATAAAQKSAEAYKTLISSIREATATNKLELAAGIDATDTQKARIKLDQELASGKVKLTAGQLASVRAALAEQDASEKALKSQRGVAAAIAELNEQRRQDFASAAAEAAANEQAVTAFGLTKAQIEALTVARLQDRLVHAADLDLTADDIAQTERLIAVKQKSADALTKTDALGYIKQLTEENRNFAANSIVDERARAVALTEIDADLWRKRISLAGDGTEQQKQLQQQFDIWYQNQSLKPMLDEQREAVKKYDDIFREGFADMLNHGKSGWKSFSTSLITTFKTTVADQIYKMLAQPFVVKMVGSLLGVTGAGGAAASAASTAAGGAGTALAGSALGGMFGAGGLSGALMGGAGWLTGATTFGGALTAGTSLIGTGTLAGLTSGIGVLAGALGPIALGIAGLTALVGKWDSSGTIHTGGAASASAAGAQTISAGTLGLQRINTTDAANQMTSQLAQSVVAILDSTATTFGKTAGYTAATAFADDTSKDGAWGALIISNLNGIVSQWGDANSRWAPKVFADGEAGQKEYLASISTSVRAALDGIGMPEWAKSMLDGLGATPALEDLAKVVDTINATQKALVLMGDRLVGFAGLSDAAASALINASGGINALATNAGAFYDAFYSEGEKTKVVTDQVAAALKAVGVQMPETRDAYRAQVEAQMALGASGAPAVAALLANAQAFASVVPAAEAATGALRSLQDVENERGNLQNQLDQLTMTQAQLAEKARAAIDGHNQALYDQVTAAQKAADVASANADYQKQIDQLLAARQGEAAIRQLEIVGMNASTVALYDRLKALKDEDAAAAAAAADAQALASTNAGYQQQINEILKSSMSAAEVRALETKGMDASTVALYDRLAGLKAEAKAAVDAKAAADALSKSLFAAVDNAFNSLTAAVNAQKKVLDAANKATMDAMQAQIDKTSASVTKLKSLSDSLHSALDGIRGQTASPAEDRASAQAQIVAALAVAKAGGAMPDADSLKGALATLSKDSSDQFASYIDYQRSNYQAALVISDLADLTDNQLSVEQLMLDSLNAQKDQAALAYEAEISRLDGVLEAAKAQVDALNGINAGVASIPAALAALATAMGAVKANPVASGTADIGGLYQSLLGRAPDADGLAFYQAQIAKGDSIDKIASYIKNSPEYAALHPPGFATGGDFMGGLRIVGEHGPELEATGPSRIFNASQTASMLRGGDGSELLAELRAQRAENAELRLMLESHLYAIAKNTLNTADSLDGAINGETPIATKEVEAA